MAMNPCIDKRAWFRRVIVELRFYCKMPTDKQGGGGVNVSRTMKKLGGLIKPIYSS